MTFLKKGQQVYNIQTRKALLTQNDIEGIVHSIFYCKAYKPRKKKDQKKFHKLYIFDNLW